MDTWPHGGTAALGREQADGIPVEERGQGRRFLACLVLGLPVMAMPLLGMWLGPVWGTGLWWAAAGLATVQAAVGSLPFFSGAVEELRRRRPAGNGLAALCISVAYLAGCVAAVGMWPEAGAAGAGWAGTVCLVAVLAAGQLIEECFGRLARRTCRQMAGLLPTEAVLVQENGRLRAVPAGQLCPGQIIHVQRGERLPADGVVKSGTTVLDETLVTGGVSGRVAKPGGRVLAGALNEGEEIQVEVTAAGGMAYLARAARLAGEQATDEDAGGLFRWVAPAIVVLAVLMGGIVLALSLARGEPGLALWRMAAVLAVVDVAALRLPATCVLARACGAGARRGVLLYEPAALRKAARADTVAMDKTGVLTEGRFTVQRVESFDESFAPEDILWIAASLEQGSGHPLAECIRREAKGRGLPTFPVVDIEALPGRGIEGRVACLGRMRLLSEKALLARSLAVGEEKAAPPAGRTACFLVAGEDVIGRIELEDTLRPEVKGIIRRLRRQGRSVVMLTGDSEAVARDVLKYMALSGMRAAMSPEDKRRWVEESQRNGHTVVVVSDGGCGAPALQQADVGVVFGGGTGLKADGGIVLVRPEPGDLGWFFTLARQVRRRMRRSRWFAGLYHLLALPLAVWLAFSPWGGPLLPAALALLGIVALCVAAGGAFRIRTAPPEVDVKSITYGG